LERIAGHYNRAEIGRAAGLQILAYDPVVSDKLVQHVARATGERLVLVLHAPDRLDRLARGLGCEPMADQNDRRDRRQPQGEAAADSKARLQAPPSASTILSGRGLRERRAWWGCLNGSLVHTT
jgi:hypothetical protein